MADALIEVVCATRLTARDFWSKSALGISLHRLGKDPRLIPRPACENRRGLPEIFNACISAENGPDVLAFIHDDVWIDDYFFADRIVEALDIYDIVGVAGNRRRVRDQPAWAFLDARWTWDDSVNLSGSVAHGGRPFGSVRRFGPAPAECELLDGVLLAARKTILRFNEVRFDPRFDFHFYDMDFCRSARAKGLRVGTWPICLTHQSNGSFGTDAWWAMYRQYIEKWGS